MKYFVKIIALVFLLYSCTQDFMLKKFTGESGGHLLYGGSNMRSFYEPVSISDSLLLKWESSTFGSYNNSSVIAYDNYIITHDLSGSIHFFDRDMGNELGVLKFPGSIASVPIINKTRMFFIVNNNGEKFATVYCYELKQGKVISKVNIDGSYSTEILKTNNALYFVSDEGEVFRFNFAGLQDWKYSTGTKTLSTPAMINNKIVFVSINGEVIIFDADAKKISARRKIGKGFFSGVTVSGKYGYAGDSEGNIYCFDVDSANVIWKSETKYKITSLPVMNEKYLYIANLFGLVSCFDKESGAAVWQSKIGGAPITTPFLFRNYLIQPNLDRYLYLIDAADGKVVKKILTGGRMKLTPVYYKGLLITGYDKGNIGAFEIMEIK